MFLLNMSLDETLITKPTLKLSVCFPGQVATQGHPGQKAGESGEKNRDQKEAQPALPRLQNVGYRKTAGVR
jgi:hypothetical protein